MRQKIIFKYRHKSMNDMTLEEQEQMWILSKTNDVFEEDINGELWQILDLTTGNEDNEKLRCKENSNKRS